MLRVAVIGSGRAGQARVRALAAHPRAELAAIVRRPDNKTRPELSEVLSDPDVDALIVCTPNLQHPSAVRACLEANKHVAAIVMAVRWFRTNFLVRELNFGPAASIG